MQGIKVGTGFSNSYVHHIGYNIWLYWHSGNIGGRSDFNEGMSCHNVLVDGSILASPWNEHSQVMLPFNNVLVDGRILAPPWNEHSRVTLPFNTHTDVTSCWFNEIKAELLSPTEEGTNIS